LSLGDAKTGLTMGAAGIHRNKRPSYFRNT
jgi:hypothetical protein